MATMNVRTKEGYRVGTVMVSTETVRRRYFDVRKSRASADIRYHIVLFIIGYRKELAVAVHSITDARNIPSFKPIS